MVVIGFFGVVVGVIIQFILVAVVGGCYGVDFYR